MPTPQARRPPDDCLAALQQGYPSPRGGGVDAREREQDSLNGRTREKDIGKGHLRPTHARLLHSVLAGPLWSRVCAMGA